MSIFTSKAKSIFTDNMSLPATRFGRGMELGGFAPLAFSQMAPSFGADHFGALSAKSTMTTAAVRDVTGLLVGAFDQPTALDLAAAALVPDDIPSDDSTTRTLTVDGPHVVSTINAPDDTDWFAVQLQAGVTYEFGQYATRTGDSGVPLRDAFIELRNADGAKLAEDDSGGPDSNTVDDALLTFTPDVDGTYYVVARSWDTGEAGVDANPATTNGDYVGDYEVFARVSTLPPPYYEIHYETEDDPSTARDEVGLPTLDSSPLHAIDWGTQFDGSSRNPDGEEGPRVTGNVEESKIGGKNVIYFYYAREGEVFVDNAANPLNLTTTIVSSGWEQWEKNAVDLALDSYESVADVVYVETDDRWAADMVFINYPGTPGPGASLLGRMSPPDTPSEGQVEWNSLDERWTQQDLAPGGFYFGTLVHELGHGHGMAHTHDNGGRSSILRGVESEVIGGTLGDFDLNQQVYTMMSYEDGWQTSPYGLPDSTDGYGFIQSVMAFDIAVLQDKYGVNEDTATGNDVYLLPDDNHTATFDADGNLVSEATGWEAIWDAGGTDSMVYVGAKDAHIDLRPASLRYEVGGGGWLSYAWGVFGGFTIANSVTIENASSGGGNDTLIGNDASNTLDGGNGVDVMSGQGGDDNYYVTLGDRIIEKADGGHDVVRARTNYILNAGAQVEILQTSSTSGTAAINLTGNDLDNSILGNAGVNILDGGIGGIDRLKGFGGDDVYLVRNGDIVLEGTGEGSDVVRALSNYALNSGAQVEVLKTGDTAGTAAINLTGNELANSIIGNAGDNVLKGWLGSDTLLGLAGADRFVFNAALGPDNVDEILDFQVGLDKVVLDDTIFAALSPGALAGGAFAVGSAATHEDQRIIYDSATGALLYDADGNGAGAAVQFATLDAGLALSASDFAVI